MLPNITPGLVVPFSEIKRNPMTDIASTASIKMTFSINGIEAIK